MGIVGLLNFVKNNESKSAIRKTHLREFQGKRAGVDAYSWLHKSIYPCAADLFMGKPTLKYVQYCMKQVKLLTSNGVTPVLVFDGANMPFKVVDKKRHEARRNAKQRAADLIAVGKQHEAYKYMVQAIDVTHEMAHNVITAAREQNIDCIVAPYEADAQLAYLLKENFIDIIITEDSDLIVFGCEKIFFKLNPDGSGDLYERIHLEQTLRTKSVRFKEFKFDKFRRAAIMSGCDYAKSLPGIGLIKAWKFINYVESEDVRFFLKKIPIHLKLKVTVDKEYVDSFIMAEMSFLYQFVFDPIRRKKVTFDEVQEEHAEDFKIFCNSFKKQEADELQLALGNVDRNNRVFGHFNLNSVAKNSIFNNRISESAPVKVESVQFVGFNEIRTSLKRTVLKDLPEINTDLDDENMISLYKESQVISQKENSPPLEPPRKKPRKCKFVKHKEEEEDEHIRSSFFSNEKSQSVESTLCPFSTDLPSTSDNDFEEDSIIDTTSDSHVEMQIDFDKKTDDEHCTEIESIDDIEKEKIEISTSPTECIETIDLERKDIISGANIDQVNDINNQNMIIEPEIQLELEVDILSKPVEAETKKIKQNTVIVRPKKREQPSKKVGRGQMSILHFFGRNGK